MPMPPLKTPTEMVTNDIGTVHTPNNNRTEPGQGEQTTLPINNVRNFADTLQPGASDV